MPRGVDRAGRVDVDGRQRGRAHVAVRGGVQRRDGRARERRPAVGGAERRDRAGQRVLAGVVARDDDERPVREDHRLRADENRVRLHRRRPRQTAVVARLADRHVLRVVGVLGVAAAAIRARGVVVARDPVLVEHRAGRRVHRRGPVQPVRRVGDVDMRAVRLDRQRADEPDAVNRVVRDRRIGRRRLRAGRLRLDRHRRQQRPLPGAARVGRDGGADVGRAAVVRSGRPGTRRRRSSPTRSCPARRPSRAGSPDSSRDRRTAGGRRPRSSRRRDRSRPR